MLSHNIYDALIAKQDWKIDGASYLIGGYIGKYEQLNSGIRKHLVYTFKNKAPVLSSNVNNFNPSFLNPNPDLFKKTLEYSKYNAKGFITEQSRIDDNFHSYLWDYYSEYPVAEAINSSQSDIAYTSFEADGKGNWIFSGTVSTASGGLTGKKAYSLGSGALSRNSLTSSQKYIVSYWLKSGGSVTVSGGSQTGSHTGKTINGWTYHEVVITGATSISLSGSGYIDEVRLYPSEAQMTTYTYDPLIGMTSKCDVNNNITYYEYDGFGRLKRVRDEDGHILKEHSYKYQISPNE